METVQKKRGGNKYPLILPKFLFIHNCSQFFGDNLFHLLSPSSLSKKKPSVLGFLQEAFYIQLSLCSTFLPLYHVSHAIQEHCC